LESRDATFVQSNYNYGVERNPDTDTDDLKTLTENWKMAESRIMLEEITSVDPNIGYGL
jgi:hypothetical protein